MQTAVVGASSYTVDSSGKIFDNDGILVVPEKGHRGLLKIRLRTDAWKWSHPQVARVVLESFDPQESSDWYSVVYRDGDSNNVALANLEWSSAVYNPLRLPGISLPLDAWLSIPGYNNYEMRITGEIRNKKSGSLLTGTTKSDGRIRVIFKNDDGNFRGEWLHRLVAMTFLPHPLDTEHLVVNHKNGDKTDNRPINLEWVTSSENNRHAFETGLRYARRVLSKNIETGVMTEHSTIRKAAEMIGVGSNYLHPYLDGVRVGKFRNVKGYMFKYSDDPDPFPTEPMTTARKIHRGKVLVKWIDSGDVKTFSSAKQLASHLKYPETSVLTLLDRSPPQPYRGIMIQPYTDTPKWPDYPDEILRVFETMKNKSNPIKVIDTETGEVTYWAGVKYWWRNHNTGIDCAVLCRYLKQSLSFGKWQFEFINLADFAYR